MLTLLEPGVTELVMLNSDSGVHSIGSSCRCRWITLLGFCPKYHLKPPQTP